MLATVTAEPVSILIIPPSPPPPNERLLFVHKVTGQAPFTVDLVVRAAGLEQDKLPPGNGRHDATRPAISAESITDWLAAGSRSFSRRFRETFGLEEKGFEQRDLAAAKAALSNMLGGMGYFAGKSEVRGAGVDGGNAPSFEASLFTAVPSRSFFPRGFLWDEGFHQVRGEGLWEF